MSHLLRAFVKLLGLVVAVVLTLTVVSPSAMAGGEPGPSPATLTLDAFTLTPDKSVSFAGTLTCLQAADVTIDMRIQQGPEARFVSVHQQAQIHCEAGGAYPVDLVFDPVHPALFHPGAIMVGIELEGRTVPDEQGNSTNFNQFGVVDIKIRF
jgi:hypothetical protein